MAGPKFTGPINYLAFAFPDGALVGEGLRRILAAVDSGSIDLLDIECVRLDTNGEPVAFQVTQLTNTAGIDVAVFDGADSELLDHDDLLEIAGELQPGAFAIVIIYEDRALATIANAWHQAGGVEVFAGGVDLVALDHIVGGGN